MSGRLENNIKIERAISNKLTKAPAIIKKYSYNFSNKTASTKMLYINNVIDFLNYMSKEMNVNVNNESAFELIKTNDINRYMEYIHYNSNGGENSPSMRATKLFSVSNFFEFLIDEDVITKNPCKRVHVPKDLVERDIVYMDASEINILKTNIINGCGTERAKKIQHKWYKRDLAIIALGCRAGLRVTSISEIDISDIDFKNKTIRITEKGNKTRLCHIGDDTVSLILDWIDDRNNIVGKYGDTTDALFISNRRTRITSKGISLLINKYSKGIDKHITPHKMRSSCATNLYEITGDIYLVKEVLGHKNIKNTERYAKMSKGKLQHAANVMDAL